MASLLLKICTACICAILVFCVKTNPCAITLRFINNQTEPRFDFSIDVKTDQAWSILELMEQAAWHDNTFKFSMEFHASVPGYMLNAIRKDTIHSNGTYVRQRFVFGDVDWTGDKTYWSIKVGGSSIPVGISIYQPKKGDTVTFQLVTFVTLHD